MRDRRLLARLVISQIRKHWKKFFVVGFVLLFLYYGYNRIFVSNRPSAITTRAQPLANVAVDKTFAFPAQIVSKQDGKIKKNQEDTLKLTFSSAELKEEIKVKGNPRGASLGKLYLILRLELNNETANRLAFASADFIRLVDKDGKLYAPDFHNGLVGIEPLSVRRDLASFIVETDQKQFSFQIGELEGDKEKIEIRF